MVSRASVKFVRISPRKVRYVMDLIRGKCVPEAHAILNGSPRRGADILRKLLNQAVDAAKRNSHAQPEDLVISKALADGGPSMKRFRAASMGRASGILKRTSHLTLELDLKKRGVVQPASRAHAAAAAPKTAKAPAGKKPAGQTKKISEKKMAGVK